MFFPPLVHHQDTIKGLVIGTLRSATKRGDLSFVFDFKKKRTKQMGTCLTTGGGPQKLDIFETTLQSSTLVETHSATKGIQE